MRGGEWGGFFVQRADSLVTALIGTHARTHTHTPPPTCTTHPYNTCAPQQHPPFCFSSNISGTHSCKYARAHARVCVCMHDAHQSPNHRVFAYTHTHEAVTLTYVKRSLRLGMHRTFLLHVPSVQVLSLSIYIYIYIFSRAL